MEVKDVLRPLRWCRFVMFWITMPNKKIIGTCDNYEVLNKSCDNE